MKWLPAILLAIVVPGTGVLSAADASNAESSDTQDLIFLAPKHPLFIRLHITINGRGFRELPDVLSESLFAALDADTDGKLDEKEAERIPPRARFRDALQSTPIKFEEIDRNANEQIEPAELRAFVRESVGNPLSLQRGADRRRLDVGLFGRFDNNDDGMVTHEEILATRRRLAQRDIDDDETLSAMEFTPLMPQAGTDTAAGGSLLIALDNSRWQSDVAFKLMRYYDSDQAGNGMKRRLQRRELGISQQAFDRLDKNGNGELGLAELTPFVQEPIPHLELLIELQTKGRPRLKITPLKNDSDVTIMPERRGRLRLMISGIEILLDTERARVRAFDDRQMFKLRFLQSDADKNGYLDENEFGGLQLPRAQFKAVDRNQDGMVQRAEVTAYVNQQSSLTRHQAKLTVAKDGKSLFETLDKNIDRRLSPREFQTAMVQLREWDANGDGRLALTEVPNKYKLTFGVGESLLFSGPEMAANQVNMQARRPAEDQSAPVWFQKMDRNRDGDISRREFLGPRATFEKIDRDGDGLIDVEEAAQVDQNAGGSQNSRQTPAGETSTSESVDASTSP